MEALIKELGRVAGNPVFITALIPAHNEAKTIQGVLRSLEPCDAIEEIIIVDDGSTDATAFLAASWADRVISLPQKQGKATALLVGVNASHGEHILMLDADLIGLQPSHVWRMIRAYAPGENIVIGVLPHRPMLTSGQRLVPRWLLESVLAETTGYGVEVALTFAARRAGLNVEAIRLDGVGHVRKEQKWPDKGIQERQKMVRDVVEEMIKQLFK